MTDTTKSVITNDYINWLAVDPAEELIFNYVPNKNLMSSIFLKNKTKQLISFKVKTNTPKSYLVKPNVGFINPDEIMTIEVSMLANTFQTTTVNNDKFLIQCAEYTTEESNPITPDMFWKLPNINIQCQKLRVNLKKIENNTASSQNNSQKMGNDLTPKNKILTTQKENETELYKTTYSKNNEQKEVSIVRSSSMSNSEIFQQNSDFDYKKKYEEILAKVDEQEKLLFQLNQDRNKYMKELSQYKNTTSLKNQGNSAFGEQENQFGFQLWHVLIAAIISLLVGAFFIFKIIKK